MRIGFSDLSVPLVVIYNNIMLDINLIRKNPEAVKAGLAAKNVKAEVIDKFLSVDKAWREQTEKIDELRAKLNVFSKERNIEEAKKVKEELKTVEVGIIELAAKRDDLLNKLPNVPDASWPCGKDESENKVLHEVGDRIKFDFEPKDYLTLGEALGIIDVERAAKVSGSRFGYLFGGAVMLEMALVQFALQKLVSKGFKAVIPPVMIKPEVYMGMGRLGGAQKEERYYLSADDLFLVGSAEHTMGPIHRDEVLEEKNLPMRYAGFSTCFRREAGSYGKDTKGILRVHQFDKVEMFSFSKPEDSKKEHEFLLSMQEELVGALKLPYRVVQICTGDMGWTDAAQYDVETWLPGQPNGKEKGIYRETNSCSNTTDFQARGTNVKYKTAKGKEFVHMLNATGFAIGRMIIAIIENYQQKNGSIKVPEVLQKYTGFDTIKIA